MKLQLLSRLGFTCNVKGDTMLIQTPPHRLDINEGIVGKADVIEEIARLYGYDRLPETRLMDELPIQKNRPQISNEQRLQDVLVNLGLQEIVTYRLTSPEREAKATLMQLDQMKYLMCAEKPDRRRPGGDAPQRAAGRIGNIGA